MLRAFVWPRALVPSARLFVLVMPSWNVNGGCVMPTVTVPLSDLFKQEPRHPTFMAAFLLYSDLPFLLPHVFYPSRCPIPTRIVIAIRTPLFVGEVNLTENTVTVLFPPDIQPLSCKGFS